MRTGPGQKFVFALILLVFQGCGYGFRSTANHWDSQGVKNLYIEPFLNNTLHPGLEVTFTSALMREFSKGRRIRIVSAQKNADAVLSGSLDQLSSQILSPTTADQVSKDLPFGQGLPSAIVVATEYAASASVSVKVSSIKGSDLWAQSFSRQKIYPAANQGGNIGNTAILINDSRFVMALEDIASKMATEIHDMFFESF